MPPRQAAKDHDLLIQIAEQTKTIFRNLERMDGQINEHLKWSNDFVEKMLPQFNKLQEQFIHVCEDLPDKGFCGKVDKMYNDMYPEGTDEPNLPQKVNLIWNDRRWIKGLLYFLVSIGLVDFGLLVKFLLGW